MSATYVGFTGQRTSLARAAMSSTSSLLYKAMRQTALLATPYFKANTPHKKNAKAAFASFFGANDPAIVSRYLGYIRKGAINDLTVTYDGDDDSKAFVYTADKATTPGGTYTADLYLCPPLFTGYSVLGTNSTLGTIIHELSHLTLGTVDHCYGMRSCVRTLSDAQKLNNADNYKYYSEVFQYSQFKMRTLSDDYDRTHRPPR